MKLVFLMLIFVLCSSFAAEDPGGFELTLSLILAIAAGTYEVISRLIPTSKTWTIIGKVLEVITWLSNLLDRKKK